MKKLKHEPLLNKIEPEPWDIDGSDDKILEQIEKRKMENEVLKKLLENLNPENKNKNEINE